MFFSSDHKSIENTARPRKGSGAVCSRCHQLAPVMINSPKGVSSYPFWGFLVFLLYSMRRVDCRRCESSSRKLVYQIDLDVTRLLWVGKERTIESFQGFFITIGEEVASKTYHSVIILRLENAREYLPDA
jgi:hypothetical protein